MPDMEFKLGVGAAASFLIVAACLGLGGFLAWAAIMEQTEPLAVAGRQVLGPAGMRYAFLLTGAAMFCTGLFLMLRELFNSGREKAVFLEANRVVVTGLGRPGEDQEMFYSEIAQVRIHRIRRIPVVDIIGHDGEKITLSAAVFREQNEFPVFRDELENRARPYRDMHGTR